MVRDGGASDSHQTTPDDLDVYRGQNRLAAIKRWVAEQKEVNDD